MVIPKILDCTLRDGGYYTNWDFEQSVVDSYVASTNQLPVDYLEIGYRSKPMKKYMGRFFYSPVYELEDIRKKSGKKLVIILDEKDVTPQLLPDLLKPIAGLIDMIRIAIDPQNLSRALVLAERVKQYGFEVGFNVMYMSKWKQYPGFIDELKNVDSVADYFYMVDSYGGVYPQDVTDTISLLRDHMQCRIGFHGHNNLELALINSLTAIEHGADIIDATILGMGRGAGNLKTELLLSVLNTRFGVEVDFNSLGNVVDTFTALHSKYEWGTNLPYMISGSNSLPQKDVMDWVTTRFYSFNSIIRALNNKKQKLDDNEQLKAFAPNFSSEKVLVIGGGKNAESHAKGVNEFLKKNPDVTVIHASSKNAMFYKDVEAHQIFCLVGNEGKRMEQVFNDLGNFKGLCVLPPYPRKMGTYVPSNIYDRAFELPSISFTEKTKDSHTALALQTALMLQAKEIYLIGYDGYQDVPISSKERILTEENESLFNEFAQKTGVLLYTLSSSNYTALQEKSLYCLI